MKPSLLLILIILSAFSCDNTQEDISKVEFRFRDSSVPPEYHRSYTLTATENKAHLTIDVYGDTLYNETFKLNNGRFGEFTKALTELNIEKSKKKDNDGCSGGTSVSLDLFTSEKKFLNGYAYRCSGEYSGTMKGDLDGLKPLIEKHFPEIGKAMDSVE